MLNIKKISILEMMRVKFVIRNIGKKLKQLTSQLLDKIDLLLYKNDTKYWPILKSVFKYLNYLYPSELNELTEDEYVKQELEKL